MSHFAKVLDGVVIDVIVAEPEFIETYVDPNPGVWIQTSYNTHGNQHPEGRPLRGNYAGIGYIYDQENDVFYPPAPYPSWILTIQHGYGKPLYHILQMTNSMLGLKILKIG